jgi:hypothetical protein
LYVPSPETVTALPRVVPPVVQVVGALACGPKTLKVTPLVDVVAEPESVALNEPAEIALPADPVLGAPTLRVGLLVDPARRISSAIDPQFWLVEMANDSLCVPGVALKTPRLPAPCCL